MRISAAALLALSVLASNGAGAGIRVVDLEKESALTVLWTKSYGSGHLVIQDENFWITLNRTIPGMKWPAARRVSPGVIVNLTPCSIELNSLVIKDSFGDVRYSEAQMANGGWSSAEPCASLSIMAPSPLKAARGSAPASGSPPPLRVNARAAAAEIPIGGHPFATREIFSRGLVTADALKISGPTGWKGPTLVDIIWVSLEGSLRISFDGRIVDVQPKTVLRIPKDYAGTIQMEPLNGPFTALLLKIQKPN